MSDATCWAEDCPNHPNAARGLCRKHYSRWRRYGDVTVVRKTGGTSLPPEQRFWSKVDKNGPIPEYQPDLGPCWLWTAALRWNGYGHFGTPGKSHVAHKFAYELLVGAVPDGLQLDHLCRVRHCLNPGHIEAVTQRVNIARGESVSVVNAAKSHCPRGHAYEPGNIKRRGKGKGRDCLTCHRDRERAAARRRKLADTA